MSSIKYPYLSLPAEVSFERSSGAPSLLISFVPVRSEDESSVCMRSLSIEDGVTIVKLHLSRIDSKASEFVEEVDEEEDEKLGKQAGVSSGFSCTISNPGIMLRIRRHKGNVSKSKTQIL